MTRNLVRLLGVSIVLVACAGIVYGAQDEGGQAALRGIRKSPVEKIFVPQDDDVRTFNVQGRSSLFRIQVWAATGGTIGEPRVVGNAKLVRSAEIINVGEGGEDPTGAMSKEFLFQCTGRGVVTIEIKTTAPGGGSDATTEAFKVTVK